MKRDKHWGMLISNEVHAKMTYISAYEGRSMSGQMIHLMQECIRAFEREHGPIMDDDCNHEKPS
ncbi:MAG: hypothetical protein RSB55_01240 [Oscillospiraceae bacterium]